MARAPQDVGISHRRNNVYEAAMRSELIISTYNAPETLRLTLLTVLAQTRRPDAIVVADDGSGSDTADMLAAFQSSHPDIPLRHVWHEDNGFQKTVILNKAIASSDADHLIFTDGDCLLSSGFIARHIELARPDRYCCGSMVRLSAKVTGLVSETNVMKQEVFTRAWLRTNNATPKASARLKSDAVPKPIGNILEHLSPVRRTFCGANASAFRAALLRVNGFDETMVWGGEDKELGIRLQNAGIKGRHLRYTAPVLHLDHPRSYADPEKARAQRAMIAAARSTGKSWTDNGITTP